MYWWQKSASDYACKYISGLSYKIIDILFAILSLKQTALSFFPRNFPSEKYHLVFVHRGKTTIKFKTTYNY